MAQYLSSEGLQALQGFESSGNATAQNPKSSASGLYGFINSTWRQQAGSLGIDTSLYPTAKSAPPNVQTYVAANTPISNWTCPGCDPGFTAALSQNPSYATNTPINTETGSFSSLSFDYAPSYGTTPTDSGFLSGLSTPDYNSNLGMSPDLAFTGGNNLTTDLFGNPLPGTSGLIGAAGPFNIGAADLGGGGKSSDWWTNAITILYNLFQRGGLILLGIILLGAAAWALARSEGMKIT